jgi:predicted GIY-YIG superfamily endonuclease/ADP-ribose pyrophosphatase YjhB (NUDIX family)
MMSTDWFLYALRCADDTLYIGVTTDLARRVSEHNSGRGARYTAGRRPVILIGAWPFADRGAAQRAEAQFRRLSRREKLQHIAQEALCAGSAFCSDEALTELLNPIGFCPRCGSLLRTIKRPEDTQSRQICTACGRVHYRNAKPCAGALITHHGRLLLVKRSVEPYLGCWDIPGGFLEVDEHPGAGAIREVREETGLEVRLTELLGFYIGRYGDGGVYCLNIYFLAEVVGSQEQPASNAASLREVADLAWFAPDELPEAIAFDHAHQVLKDWAEHVQRERYEPGIPHIRVTGSQ